MSKDSWPWLALFLLGVWHGVNPAMGWLFAVALGMQEKSRQAVARSLLPIGFGHGLAIAAVVLIAVLARQILPLAYVKVFAALILLLFGALRLRNRHPRWVGMRVGFRDLTVWSFLMASAHGAGFMLVPVLLATSAGGHAGHMAAYAVPNPITAVLIHTMGYLLVTGLVAILVYEKFGLALLGKAWVNLDVIWAVALLATGCLTLAVG